MTPMPLDDDDDCWDAFGSDNEEDSSNDVEQGVLWLTRHFLRWNPQIPLSQRRVMVQSHRVTFSEWVPALQARGIQVTTSKELIDALIMLDDDDDDDDDDDVNSNSVVKQTKQNVVPNGVVLCNSSSALVFDEQTWSDPEQVGTTTSTFVARIKHACPINESSCPWLSSTHEVKQERTLLAQATVTTSALEQLTTRTASLTEHDLCRATTSLNKYGYCIIRNLVDPNRSLQWGQAVLDDLKEAHKILLSRHNIDIKSPGVDTTNYRELAMREDLRMDLRDGPQLRVLREQEQKHYEEWGVDVETDPSLAASPIVTTSTGSYDSCLHFHPDILEIVKRTMNPKDAVLYKGNFGRYNFEGSGPDGSHQALRIGPMGGIVSLPGSADQAIHADTPHLFEHLDCLPAHYINAFCLGADLPMERDADGNATGSTPVGGTVFIHESHRLSFTAEVEELSLIGNDKMLHNLVRPSLQLGDVVLFDCRILHFGLANNSQDVERPLLYTNMTHAWFHDPKNWDDRQRIFKDE